jgi:hypothetical protein
MNYLNYYNEQPNSLTKIETICTYKYLLFFILKLDRNKTCICPNRKKHYFGSGR